MPTAYGWQPADAAPRISQCPTTHPWWAHFRRELRAYQARTQLDLATLACQMEDLVPGMLAVPHRALQAFLDGEGEPSDAFINICTLSSPRQNRGASGQAAIGTTCPPGT